MEKITQTFSSPEEELQYLRKVVAEKESAVITDESSENVASVAGQEVVAYKDLPAEDVLAEDFSVSADEIERVALKLAPEPHDEKMQELITLVKEKGIKNTLRFVDSLNDPHIEDDFHRFLVEYIREGHEPTGVKSKSELSRSLHMTLYEVVLPRTGNEDNESPRSIKELLSSMEQFYAGMLSVSAKGNQGQNYFSIELTIPNYHEDYIFFASVPEDKEELFEKQMASVFPEAQVKIQINDYNIFNENGVTAGSVATSKGNPIYATKTYEKFDHDPLNTILGSFLKIDRDGEGAAIQFVFNPVGGEVILGQYKHALTQIKEGKPLKEVIKGSSISGEFFKEVKSLVFSPKKKDELEDRKPVDEKAVEEITEKTRSPIYNVNIRLIASSKTQAEADAILSDMESAFSQFENTHGNKLGFKRLQRSALRDLLKKYSFRVFDSAQAIPLNTAELTTMLHFQTQAVTAGSQLKQVHTSEAPPPTNLPVDGVVLGVNRYSGIERPIKMMPEDRLRHFYVIGQTGTGKSTLLKNMIVQDIKNGDGVCFIDPHGADVQDILGCIPESRYDDVIYFDPSHTARPMGLNMLEYDTANPEQKTFVVNELFSIFQKLYGGVPESMGPMFEQYFRNATMLVIEDPESGSTLLDVSRVLADDAYRALKLSKCKNPVVVQFWQEIAQKAGGEASLQNIVPYITSKFDVFLSNEIMRPIVAQQKSAINFRKIMDEKKILLVDLSKGRLGDINANLIGLIVVGKILMSTLARVDSYGKEIPPFYLYIDEFQNVTTNSISTILSEARKYKLSLTVAHQFIAQLEEDIRDSVFGNVGSMAAYRVGSDDAEYLAKQFGPSFDASDLMNIENRNAHLKLLINGQPTRPFNIEALPPEQGNIDQVQKLKEYSHLRFGRPREDVEAEILKKYQKKVE